MADQEFISNKPPPPIPDRPSSSSSSFASHSLQSYPGAAYAGYSPGYPMQSSYGYGGGGYGSYPSYGGGFGSYRGLGFPTAAADGNASGSPRFVRLAEENTRPAFETIQSVVTSFNSISMMFESTFFALHSSFRAMLSVVEHMTRAKAQLSHVLSAFTAIRMIKWVYLKMARLLGFSPDSSVDARQGAASVDDFDVSQFESHRVNWPILLYTALTVAAPYLMWKLISSFAVHEEEEEEKQNSQWMSGREEHFVALAQFDFQAERDEEITIRSGQEITVAPKHKQPKIRGWLLGSVDGRKAGLFPANYVRIVGKKVPPGNKQPDLLPPSLSGALEDAFK